MTVWLQETQDNSWFTEEMATARSLVRRSVLSPARSYILSCGSSFCLALCLWLSSHCWFHHGDQSRKPSAQGIVKGNTFHDRKLLLSLFSLQGSQGQEVWENLHVLGTYISKGFMKNSVFWPLQLGIEPPAGFIASFSVSPAFQLMWMKIHCF